MGIGDVTILANTTTVLYIVSLGNNNVEKVGGNAISTSVEHYTDRYSYETL